MFKFFDQLTGFLGSIVDFFINFFNGVVSLINLCSYSIEKFGVFVELMPEPIVLGLSLIVLVAVVFLVLGR